MSAWVPWQTTEHVNSFCCLASLTLGVTSYMNARHNISFRQKQTKNFYLPVCWNSPAFIREETTAAENFACYMPAPPDMPWRTSASLFVSKDQPRNHEAESSKVVLVSQINKLHRAEATAWKHLCCEIAMRLPWMEEYSVFHWLPQCFSFWQKVML